MTDEPRKKGFLTKFAGALVSAVIWLVLFIGSLWAFGALWFDLPQSLMPRVWAFSFAAVVLLVVIVLRPRWRAKLVVLAGILLVMTWWFTLQPKLFRDWKPEVAVSPRALIDGDTVTFYNVRDFDYRTEKDFTERYEMRKVNLKNLKGVDIFITYWGSPYMAHPILSFDFGTDGRICFSIETRPEKSESYSAIGGLYRQFEQIYIVATERDVIRVRTNYRKGEDVYLYHMGGQNVRDAFLEYVRTVNELHENPRWYNAVTNNCTTAIRNQETTRERPPLDWRMLVNGYGDELLYERGNISRTLPFAELKQRSHINSRAKAADADPDFSTRIREGLPGMD